VIDQLNQNNDRQRRTRRRLGCSCGTLAGVLIALAIVGGVGIGIAAVVAPDLLNGVMGGVFGMPVKQTRAISGDPGHFNPFKAFAEARDFAATDAELISITAYYVRADGTMDLTATYTPAPSTEYKFVHQVARPANAPPVGAGGSASGNWYEPVTITAFRPGERQSISETSGNTSFSYDFVNQGYSRETDDPTSALSEPTVPAPQCDLAQLWKVAIQTKDAPQDAVATVTYSATGYEFSIASTTVSLTFDKDCKVVSS